MKIVGQDCKTLSWYHTWLSQQFLKLSSWPFYPSRRRPISCLENIWNYYPLMKWSVPWGDVWNISEWDLRRLYFPSLRTCWGNIFPDSPQWSNVVILFVCQIAVLCKAARSVKLVNFPFFFNSDGKIGCDDTLVSPWENLRCIKWEANFSINFIRSSPERRQ